MKITIRLLKSKGACEDQIEKFKTLFPEGVVLTEAACMDHAQTFNWGWAAEMLLTPKARKLYDETCAPARKLYDETCASARKLYHETCAPAFARAALSDLNNA